MLNVVYTSTPRPTNRQEISFEIWRVGLSRRGLELIPRRNPYLIIFSAET